MSQIPDRGLTATRLKVYSNLAQGPATQTFNLQQIQNAESTYPKAVWSQKDGVRKVC